MFLLNEELRDHLKNIHNFNMQQEIKDFNNIKDRHNIF